MNFVVTLYAALLFFILTPNVLLRLPRKGSVKVVAAVHAVVFGLLFHFTTQIVSRLSMGMMPMRQEGLIGSECSADKPCDDNEDCLNGVCSEKPMKPPTQAMN